MSRKIVGVTVGTPLSPKAMDKKLKHVALVSDTAIAPNTDLNTVTAFGNYNCDADTAKTLLNHPVSAAFIMRVGSYDPGAEGKYYQEVIIRSGVRYYRYSYLSDAGKLTWNLWRQSFDTNNLIPARYGGLGANASSDRGEAAHMDAVQKFIDKMNEMATQFGMNNTVYKTPSGLCSKPINANKVEFTTEYNSYTTAYDSLRLMVAVRHTPTVYKAMGTEICRYFKNGGAYSIYHSNLGNSKWKNWAAENGYIIRAIKGGSLDGEFAEFGDNPIMNFVFIIESNGSTYAVSVTGLVNEDYTTLRTLVHDLIDMANGGAETTAISDAKSRAYPVGMAVAKLTANGCFDDDIAALDAGVFYNENTVRATASLAKIMTALVACSYMGNHECSVNYNDLVGSSSLAEFKMGDITSTTDALSLALSTSDNIMATMLARICGEKISVDSSEDADAPRNHVVLIDQNTGASYQIFVVNGKLTMTEVE